MIIDNLQQEHRNVERLLLALEQELGVFDAGERPDYEVIRAIIAYFEVYPEAYHHPEEDAVFEKLKARDPDAAARIGDLEAEHRAGAERLRRVMRVVEGVLADREVLRETVHDVIRDFIEHQRRHLAMEERDFFPVARKTLTAEDWAEIDAILTERADPIFSDVVDSRFDAVRKHILQLEKDAQAERASWRPSHALAIPD